MKETQRHLDAFELYLLHKQSGTNTEDSIKLLVGDLKVTRKTLYIWKKEFNWDEKEAIRSLEINKEIQTKTNKSIVDNKIQYLGVYHRLLKKLADNGYNIDICNVNDLSVVVKGALLLQDEPTENIKSDTTLDEQRGLERLRNIEAQHNDSNSDPRDSTTSPDRNSSDTTG
jgi:hypothetical protein